MTHDWVASKLRAVILIKDNIFKGYQVVLLIKKSIPIH